MASKLGFLLSLVFVLQVLLFGGDMLSVQLIHSNLDAWSMTLAERISMSGRLDAELLNQISDEGINFSYIAAPSFRFGDAVSFKLEQSYDAFVLSDQPIDIQVSRTVIIGYYN